MPGLGAVFSATRSAPNIVSRRILVQISYVTGCLVSVPGPGFFIFGDPAVYLDLSWLKIQSPSFPSIHIDTYLFIHVFI